MPPPIITSARSARVWTRPPHLTPNLKGRLDMLRDLVAEGVDRNAAARAMGYAGWGSLANLLWRLTGSETWPPLLPASLDALPVVEPRNMRRAATELQAGADAKQADDELAAEMRVFVGRRGWTYDRLGNLVSISPRTLKAFAAGEAALSAKAAMRLRRAMRLHDLGRAETFEARAARIEAMKDEAQARREAHERWWLGEEQRRYGLARPGKALSGMVA